MRKGPKKEVPGNPGVPDGKGKGKEGGNGTGKGKEKGKKGGSKGDGKSPKENPKAPGGKSNKEGKGKGKSKAPDPLWEQAKEQGLCVFYQRNLCRRDNCPFKHEKLSSVPANPAPPAANQGNTGKAKSAASQPKANPKAAAVAMVVAATVTSGATATYTGPACALDVIADTGAGEHLGSREAFMTQGAEKDVVEHCCGTSLSHIAFETGGGKKNSNESIGLWSESLKSVANMFMLKA